MTDNRRTRMTKKMIQNAFLELLEKQPITKITVTRICEKADVNRSTFYAYYVDIESLLAEIENEVLRRIPAIPEISVPDQSERHLDMLEIFFEYVRQNEKVLRVLMIRAENGKFIEKLSRAAMTKYSERPETKEAMLSRYGYIYCFNGVTGLTKEWIKSRFPISSREFARIVLRMTEKTIAAEHLEL